MGLCLPDDLTIYEALLPLGHGHRAAVPPDDEASCPIHEYILTCCYAQDVAKFKQLCQDTGAHILGVIRSPFWNVWGRVVGAQYVMVYQHTERLEMEVLC